MRIALFLWLAPGENWFFLLWCSSSTKRTRRKPCNPWVCPFVEISSRSSRSAKLGWSSLLHNLPEKRGPSGEPIWRTQAKQSLFFPPLLSYPDWLPAYIRPLQSLAWILKHGSPGQRPWPYVIKPGKVLPDPQMLVSPPTIAVQGSQSTPTCLTPWHCGGLCHSKGQLVYTYAEEAATHEGMWEGSMKLKK
jgi:hypothetical protein